MINKLTMNINIELLDVNNFEKTDISKYIDYKDLTENDIGLIEENILEIINKLDV